MAKTEEKETDLSQNDEQSINIDVLESTDVLISKAIKREDVNLIKTLLQKENIFSKRKTHSCWLLTEAINSKNTEIVSILLKHGVCVQSCSSVKNNLFSISFDSALHRAVNQGCVPIIKELILYKANWKKLNTDRDTVLHLAFNNNYLHKNCVPINERAEMKAKSEEIIIQILKLFLDLGMDVNVKNKQKQSPLFLAASHKMINVAKYLLKRGAKVSDELFFHSLILDGLLKSFDREKGYGIPDPKLILHIEQDNIEFFDWFLSQGFNVDHKNHQGKTPLQLAVEHNQVYLLPTLLKYANDMKMRGTDRKSTILHILLNSNPLKQKMSNEEITYLKLKDGREDIDEAAKLMINKGIPMDSGTPAPCVIAAEQKRANLLIFMLNRKKRSKVAELIVPVVRNWIENDRKYPPGVDEVISILISKDVLLNDDVEFRMMLILCAAHHKFEKTFEVLRTRPTDVKVCSSQKENLLHIALQNRSRLTKNYQLTEDAFKYLINLGCDVNGQTIDGRTPLHEAVRFYRVSKAKCLIKYGADVNAKDSQTQNTPLHLAFYESCGGMCQLLINNKRTDINARQSEGKTPCHLAISQNIIYVLKELLKLGADLDIEDNECRKPLEIAFECQNDRAVKCLLEYGVDFTDIRASLIPECNNCSYNKAWDFLFRHYMKLRVISLPYPKLYQPHVESYNGKFDLEFQEECNKLKCFIIEGSVSMYDFLHMSPNKRFVYTQHEKFPKQEYRVTSEFPLYHSIIIASYRDAIARKPLQEPAKKAWFELTEIYLPDICIERIIDYCNIRSLKVMAGWMQKKKLKRPAKSNARNMAKKIKR